MIFYQSNIFIIVNTEYVFCNFFFDFYIQYRMHTNRLNKNNKVETHKNKPLT